MALTFTLNLPEDVETRLRSSGGDLGAEVREAFALELFRESRLSHAELSHVLGLDRFQTDALLKRRGIYENSPTSADLDADRATLDRLFGGRH